MGEQAPGTQPPMPPEETERKLVVFAPRIGSILREQVEGLRQITGQTINEVGEEALQGWVSSKLADEELRAQAMAGIEDEERKLQERREAIAKVLGSTANAPGGDAPGNGGDTGRGGRRAKAKK